MRNRRAQILKKYRFTSSAAYGATPLCALCIHTSHKATGTGTFPVGKHSGTTYGALRRNLLYNHEANEQHPTTAQHK